MFAVVLEVITDVVHYSVRKDQGRKKAQTI